MNMEKQPYKIFGSKYIYGVGQAFIIVAIQDFPDDLHKAVEYHAILMNGKTVEDASSYVLHYSKVPEQFLPLESLIDQGFQVAKPEVDAHIHRKRETLVDDKWLIPYNAEFEFSEVELIDFRVAAIRTPFISPLSAVSMKTKNGALQHDLDFSRYQTTWSIEKAEL